MSYDNNEDIRKQNILNKAIRNEHITEYDMGIIKTTSETSRKENSSRFFTVKEFANYMNIGTTKAYEFIRGNHNIAINIGGKWLIDKIKLDKWIDKNLY